LDTVTDAAGCGGVQPPAVTRLPRPKFFAATMKLSLFSDYSLRVLMFAALKGGSFRVDEVTAAYGISRHHVAKVVQSLAQLGYLQTRRGRGGGIQLAVAAADVRIGKLVRQTEDEPALVECFDPATNTCPISGNCLLKGALAQGISAFYAALDRHTLQDLVTGPAQSPMSRALFAKNPVKSSARPASAGGIKRTPN
jgi:Rrf2 family transcriptional regulator, nitric oxide-sensitive transcriptional repressor